MDVGADLASIQDEELLRRMWQQSEDFARKKEIRQHLYKLRESRLCGYYNTATEQQQQQQPSKKPGDFNKNQQKSNYIIMDGVQLADQSYQSFKNKEIRDSESPIGGADSGFVEKTMRNTNPNSGGVLRPDTSGWNITSSSTLNPDGSGYKNESLATTEGSRKIDGGQHEFAGINQHMEQASQHGDDKNFVKTAAESSKTNLQESSVVGDENSGRIEKKSSTVVSSSSKSFSKKQTTSGDLGDFDSRFDSSTFGSNPFPALLERRDSTQSNLSNATDFSTRAMNPNQSLKEKLAMTRQNVESRSTSSVRKEEYHNTQKSSTTSNQQQDQHRHYEIGGQHHLRESDNNEREHQKYQDDLERKLAQELSQQNVQRTTNTERISSQQQTQQQKILRQTENINREEQVRRQVAQQEAIDDRYLTKYTDNTGSTIKKSGIINEDSPPELQAQFEKLKAQPGRVLSQDVSYPKPGVKMITTKKELPDGTIVTTRDYETKAPTNLNNTTTDRQFTKSVDQKGQQITRNTNDTSRTNRNVQTNKNSTDVVDHSTTHHDNYVEKIRDAVENLELHRTVKKDMNQTMRDENITQADFIETDRGCLFVDRNSGQPERYTSDACDPNAKIREERQQYQYQSKDVRQHKIIKEDDFQGTHGHGFPSQNAPDDNLSPRSKANDDGFRGTHGFPSARSPDRNSNYSTTSTNKDRHDQHSQTKQHDDHFRGTHGFPSVNKPHDGYSPSVKSEISDHFEKRNKAVDEAFVGTHGFPSNRTPTENERNQQARHPEPNQTGPNSKQPVDEDFRGTHGFPSVPVDKNQESREAPTQQYITNAHKHLDANHEAFARSLRCASPIENTRRGSNASQRSHRANTHSVHGSTRSQDSPGRERSVLSDYSHISSGTVTKGSTPRTPTKHQTTKDVYHSNETIDLPSKTVTTKTTTTKTTSNDATPGHSVRSPTSSPERHRHTSAPHSPQKNKDYDYPDSKYEKPRNLLTDKSSITTTTKVTTKNIRNESPQKYVTGKVEPSKPIQPTKPGQKNRPLLSDSPEFFDDDTETCDNQTKTTSIARKSNKIDEKYSTLTSSTKSTLAKQTSPKKINDYDSPKLRRKTSPSKIDKHSRESSPDKRPSISVNNTKFTTSTTTTLTKPELKEPLRPNESINQQYSPSSDYTTSDFEFIRTDENETNSITNKKVYEEPDTNKNIDNSTYRETSPKRPTHSKPSEPFLEDESEPENKVDHPKKPLKGSPQQPRKTPGRNTNTAESTTKRFTETQNIDNSTYRETSPKRPTQSRPYEPFLEDESEPENKVDHPKKPSRGSPQQPRKAPTQNSTTTESTTKRFTETRNVDNSTYRETSPKRPTQSRPSEPFLEDESEPENKVDHPKKPLKGSPQQPRKTPGRNTNTAESTTKRFTETQNIDNSTYRETSPKRPTQSRPSEPFLEDESEPENKVDHPKKPSRGSPQQPRKAPTQNSTTTESTTKRFTETQNIDNSTYRETSPKRPTQSRPSEPFLEDESEPENKVDHPKKPLKGSPQQPRKTPGKNTNTTESTTKRFTETQNIDNSTYRETSPNRPTHSKPSEPFLEDESEPENKVDHPKKPSRGSPQQPRKTPTQNSTTTESTTKRFTETQNIDNSTYRETSPKRPTYSRPSERLFVDESEPENEVDHPKKPSKESPQQPRKTPERSTNTTESTSKRFTETQNINNSTYRETSPRRPTQSRPCKQFDENEYEPLDHPDKPSKESPLQPRKTTEKTISSTVESTEQFIDSQKIGSFPNRQTSPKRPTAGTTEDFINSQKINMPSYRETSPARKRPTEPLLEIDSESEENFDYLHKPLKASLQKQRKSPEKIATTETKTKRFTETQQEGKTFHSETSPKEPKKSNPSEPFIEDDSEPEKEIYPLEESTNEFPDKSRKSPTKMLSKTKLTQKEYNESHKIKKTSRETSPQRKVTSKPSQPLLEDDSETENNLEHPVKPSKTITKQQKITQEEKSGSTKKTYTETEKVKKSTYCKNVDKASKPIRPEEEDKTESDSEIEEPSLISESDVQDGLSESKLFDQKTKTSTVKNTSKQFIDTERFDAEFSQINQFKHEPTPIDENLRPRSTSKEFYDNFENLTINKKTKKEDILSDKFVEQEHSDILEIQNSDSRQPFFLKEPTTSDDESNVTMIETETTTTTKKLHDDTKPQSKKPFIRSETFDERCRKILGIDETFEESSTSTTRKHKNTTDFITNERRYQDSFIDHKKSSPSPTSSPRSSSPRKPKDSDVKIIVTTTDNTNQTTLLQDEIHSDIESNKTRSASPSPTRRSKAPTRETSPNIRPDHPEVSLKTITSKKSKDVLKDTYSSSPYDSPYSRSPDNSPVRRPGTDSAYSRSPDSSPVRQHTTKKTPIKKVTPEKTRITETKTVYKTTDRHEIAKVNDEVFEQPKHITTARIQISPPSVRKTPIDKSPSPSRSPNKSSRDKSPSKQTIGRETNSTSPTRKPLEPKRLTDISPTRKIHESFTSTKDQNNDVTRTNISETRTKTTSKLSNIKERTPSKPKEKEFPTTVDNRKKPSITKKNSTITTIEIEDFEAVSDNEDIIIIEAPTRTIENKKSSPTKKYPITERKESAPVNRTTQFDREQKFTRSTSDNIFKTNVTKRTPITKATDNNPKNRPNTTSESPKSPRKISNDHKKDTKGERRPSKCLTTKTINLTTTNAIINSHDMDNVIIDIQQAKSSREPSPNKIIPVPVSTLADDDYDGYSRYPDQVQEPEDAKRTPKVRNIPIYQETLNDFVGCQITEIKETDDSVETKRHRKNINQTREFNDTSTMKEFVTENNEQVDEECLLSVHEKVNKFINTAEEVKKPKISSPFKRNIQENEQFSDDDQCHLSVNDKVNKFLTTAEKITKNVITSTGKHIERINIDEIDEDLRNDECVLSVSEKVNKFRNTAEKLSVPQKSPNLVAQIDRQISKHSEDERNYENKTDLKDDYPNKINGYPRERSVSPVYTQTVRKSSKVKEDVTNVETSKVFSHQKTKITDRYVPHKPKDTPRMNTKPIIKTTETVRRVKSVFENGDIKASKPTVNAPKQRDIISRPSVWEAKRNKDLSDGKPKDVSVNKVFKETEQIPRDFKPVYDKQTKIKTTHPVSLVQESVSSKKNIFESKTIVSKNDIGQAALDVTERLTSKSYPRRRSGLDSPTSKPVNEPGQRKPSTESQRKPVTKESPVTKTKKTVPISSNTEYTDEYVDKSKSVRNTDRKLPHSQSPTRDAEYYNVSTTKKVYEASPEFIDEFDNQYDERTETKYISNDSTNLYNNEPMNFRKPVATSRDSSPQRHTSSFEETTKTTKTTTVRNGNESPSVLARKNIFENSEPKLNGYNSPTPRPSYMDHTKSSLEHIRRDSIEINRTNYSRKTSLDEESIETNPHSAVKFGVQLKHSPLESKPRRKSGGSEFPNIEEIFDLEILEQMLRTVVEYEQRRVIRSQIRVVKKIIDQKKREEAQIARIRETSPARRSTPPRSPSPTILLSSRREDLRKKTREEQVAYIRETSPIHKSPVRSSTNISNSEMKHTRTNSRSNFKDFESRNVEKHETLIRERSISPKSKVKTITTITEVRKVGGTNIPEKTVTTKKVIQSDSDDKPIWATKNILKKASESNRSPRSTGRTVKKTQSATTTRTSHSQSQKEKIISDEDVITSSYGIGPTDEEGRPLFGLKALKTKKPSETSKVTGTVVSESYYSENGQTPVGERKITVYSTDPNDIDEYETKYDHKKRSGSIKRESLQKDGLTSVTRTQKFGDDTRFDADEIETLSNAMDFDSSRKVRRGSVKEMSEKFIRKESSSSVTEKTSSSSSYPKAGLILRTRTRTKESSPATHHRAGSYEDDEDFEESGYEHNIRRKESKSRSIHESESESESINISKTVNSTSTRSFLDSSGRKVTGVNDVLERMRNADNIVKDGDTMEDREARALLNKFLGASVLMSGVESMMPAQEVITTKVTKINSEPIKEVVKTTRVTKTIKSEGNSSAPVSVETSDIEEIWDEEILKELLEQSTSYEERRKIRARIKQLMAEREACTDIIASVKAELEENSKTTNQLAQSRTTTEIVEVTNDDSDEDSSVYEEIIEEIEVTDDDDDDDDDDNNSEIDDNKNKESNGDVDDKNKNNSIKSVTTTTTKKTGCGNNKTESVTTTTTFVEKTKPTTEIVKTVVKTEPITLTSPSKVTTKTKLTSTSTEEESESETDNKQGKKINENNNFTETDNITVECIIDNDKELKIETKDKEENKEEEEEQEELEEAEVEEEFEEESESEDLLPLLQGLLRISPTQNQEETQQQQQQPQTQANKTPNMSNPKSISSVSKMNNCNKINSNSIKLNSNNSNSSPNNINKIYGINESISANHLHKEDSGTESGEDLKLLAAGLRDSMQSIQNDTGLIPEVTAALARLEQSLKEGKDFHLDLKRRNALLTLVSRLQTGLTSPDKIKEPTPAPNLSNNSNNTNEEMETSSPEADNCRGSNRQRFAKRRSRANRHTVGVSREELADARRYMEEMIMIGNISKSTTPESSTATPDTQIALQKQNSSGAILTYLNNESATKEQVCENKNIQRPTPSTLYRPNQFVPNHLTQQTGQKNEVNQSNVQRREKKYNYEPIKRQSADYDQQQSNGLNNSKRPLSESYPSSVEQNYQKQQIDQQNYSKPHQYISENIQNGYTVTDYSDCVESNVNENLEQIDPNENCVQPKSQNNIPLNRFSNKKLAMKRANTIDIPKPMKYLNDMESDSEAEEHGVNSTKAIGLRGTVQVTVKSKPKSFVQAFEPKTENDLKFLAFIQKKGPAPGLAWNNPNRTVSNWTNKFGNIKQTFESKSFDTHGVGKPPVGPSNSAKNFWKKNESQLYTSKTQIANDKIVKPPWADKTYSSDVLTSALKTKERQNADLSRPQQQLQQQSIQQPNQVQNSGQSQIIYKSSVPSAGQTNQILSPTYRLSLQSPTQNNLHLYTHKPPIHSPLQHHQPMLQRTSAVQLAKPIPLNQFSHASQSVFKPVDPPEQMFQPNDEQFKPIQTDSRFHSEPYLNHPPSSNVINPYPEQRFELDQSQPMLIQSQQQSKQFSIVGKNSASNSPHNLLVSPSNYMNTMKQSGLSSPILPWVTKDRERNRIRSKAQKYDKRSPPPSHLHRQSSLHHRENVHNLDQNDIKRPSLPDTSEPIVKPSYSVQPVYYSSTPHINKLPANHDYENSVYKKSVVPIRYQGAQKFHKSQPTLEYNPPITVQNYGIMPVPTIEHSSVDNNNYDSDCDTYQDSLTNPNAQPLVLTSTCPTFDPHNTVSESYSLQHPLKIFDYPSPSNSIVSPITFAHNDMTTDDEVDSEILTEYKAESKVMTGPVSQQAVTVSGNKTQRIGDPEIYGKNSAAAKNLLSTMKSINPKSIDKKQIKQDPSMGIHEQCLSPDGRSYQAPQVEPIFPDLNKVESNRAPEYVSETQQIPNYQQNPIYVPNQSQQKPLMRTDQPISSQKISQRTGRMDLPDFTQSVQYKQQMQKLEHERQQKLYQEQLKKLEQQKLQQQYEQHKKMLEQQKLQEQYENHKKIMEQQKLQQEYEEHKKIMEQERLQKEYEAHKKVMEQQRLQKEYEEHKNFMEQQRLQMEYEEHKKYLEQQKLQKQYEEHKKLLEKQKQQEQHEHLQKVEQQKKKYMAGQEKSVPFKRQTSKDFNKVPQNYETKPNQVLNHTKQQSKDILKQNVTSQYQYSDIQKNLEQHRQIQETYPKSEEQIQNYKPTPPARKKSTPKVELNQLANTPQINKPNTQTKGYQDLKPVKKLLSNNSIEKENQHLKSLSTVKPTEPQLPETHSSQQTTKQQALKARQRSLEDHTVNEQKSQTIQTQKKISSNTEIIKNKTQKKVTAQQEIYQANKKLITEVREDKTEKYSKLISQKSQGSVEKVEYKSSAPADTPDIVKSSLLADDIPILKKFGPPQRHHYTPNCYKTPISKSESSSSALKTSSSTTFTSTNRKMSEPSVLVKLHQQQQQEQMNPEIVETPATPAVEQEETMEEVIPRNIVFNNVAQFSNMSRRVSDTTSTNDQIYNRSIAIVKANALSKSDSWNQICKLQQQVTTKPPSPKFGEGNQLRRTKSGHSLAVPKMYEGSINREQVSEKQNIVASYFSGNKSPNTLSRNSSQTNITDNEKMSMSSSMTTSSLIKKSSINRTRTSEKSSVGKHLPPGGLVRSQTMPHIDKFNLLDEKSNVTQTTKTEEKDGAVVTTTTKVTTRTVTGSSAGVPKPVSPFAKFKQLDKQNSIQSPNSPQTPNTPGGANRGAQIFAFTDPAVAQRAATAKEQLLQWCQSKTKEYENVQITNFSTSWNDGMAFCALIHHFLPDTFDFNRLNPKMRRQNFELAFRVADEKAGIAPLLDVEDMVVMKRPDWKCVFTYVQSIYRRFRNCQ